MYRGDTVQDWPWQEWNAGTYDCCAQGRLQLVLPCVGGHQATYTTTLTRHLACTKEAWRSNRNESKSAIRMPAALHAAPLPPRKAGYATPRAALHSALCAGKSRLWQSLLQYRFSRQAHHLSSAVGWPQPSQGGGPSSSLVFTC